jgi:hypothetical protein
MSISFHFPAMFDSINMNGADRASAEIISLRHQFNVLRRRSGEAVNSAGAIG